MRPKGCWAGRGVGLPALVPEAPAVPAAGAGFGAGLGAGLGVTGGVGVGVGVVGVGVVAVGATAGKLQDFEPVTGFV